MTTNADTPAGWLTVQDAAARVGTKAKTLAVAVCRGAIESRKDGRRRLVRAAAVDHYAATHGTPPAGWLTMADAAARVGVSRAAIHKAAKAGRLTVQRGGWRLVVSVDSVDHYAAGRRAA